MARTGYIRLIAPGLTYATRLTYKTDLSMDPTVVTSPLEGEWLTPDVNQKLVRDIEQPSQFVLVDDRGRTDIQSNQGYVTVLAHKGLVLSTALYAVRQVGPAAIDYALAPQQDLTLCLALGEDLSPKVMLCPVGMAAVGAPALAGDIVTVSVIEPVVARLLRIPHQETGVGSNGRRSIIDVIVL